MDERRFLEELEYELRASGMDGEVIKKRIGQFEKFFATLSADEIAETLEGLGDISDVAQNIKALAGKGAKKEEPEEKPDGEDPFPDIPVVVDEIPSPEGSGDDTGESAPEQPQPDADALPESSPAESETESYFDDFGYVAESAPETQAEDAPENTGEATKYIDINALREASLEGTLPGVEEEFAQTISIETSRIVRESPERTGEGARPSPKIELDFNELDLAETEIRPTARGRAVFIAGALLTLPVTLPLLLVILLLIGSVFAVVSVAIAALIALLVAVVIAGVAIPLIGIIFGIIQTYTVFSAGLYEIGLGLAVAGCAMFSGILIYNFAVRFLPFVLKKFTVFSKFIFRSIGRLILRVRRECVTL